MPQVISQPKKPGRPHAERATDTGSLTREFVKFFTKAVENDDLGWVFGAYDSIDYVKRHRGKAPPIESILLHPEMMAMVLTHFPSGYVLPSQLQDVILEALTVVPKANSKMNDDTLFAFWLAAAV